MSDRHHEEEREHEKGFRVVDRRRFTSEGEAREGAPPESASSPEPVRPAPEAPRRESREQPPQAQQQKGRGDPRQAAPEPQPEQQGGIDFLAFCASLATNALAAMGALPEHEARGLPRSPELAREYIEILAMLQQKTRGNLSRQEEQALTQMVSELKMHFVETTRRR